MKLWSSVAGRVDLDRQPPLGEVDLHLVRALPQAAADLGLVLAQQVVDELLARVAGDLVGRVHEAQGRRRDDRLLHRHVGVPQGHVEVAVGVPLVAERAGGQPRHPADVAGRERDLEAVRGGVRQPVDAVRPEVVVLPLLAVGDDRRAGGLEPRDRVADRLLVERVQRRVGAVGRARPPRSARAAAGCCRSARSGWSWRHSRWSSAVRPLAARVAFSLSVLPGERVTNWRTGARKPIVFLHRALSHLSILKMGLVVGNNLCRLCEGLVSDCGRYTCGRVLRFRVSFGFLGVPLIEGFDGNS